ncbi:16S rRNA (cytosine(967)-C(5))-methyltransferase [Phormidium tenue FACHB-886]|nr:16S rRNA (cytosine(967)-C(5))-methyltransferase [Phormidium tenue FACHB-886]
MSERSQARQVALTALRAIQHGAFADIALDKALRQSSLEPADRRLVTELVYGSIRRQRTLDALVEQLAKKKSQPPDLRLILHLGLYQLRYLSQIPSRAAVDTTVDLAKQNGFTGLAGFVNGLLRQYARLSQAQADPLVLPAEAIAQIAIQQSYPDWIVQVWADQFGIETAAQLCEWLNRPPHIDLRVNPLKTTIAQAEAALQAAGIAVQRVPPLPQALRLPPSVGAIQKLPGFAEGWWTVQDSSAQLVSHLLDPQPGETVIDVCAAPGGKTTHIAELMQDQGVVWGCDRHESRLRKLQQNAERLQLQSIRLQAGDSRQMTFAESTADRVLLDAPCSGLGTLHRHADARWRQTPTTVKELAQLQAELLNHAATWVKPGGVLVYATCTLHPLENEAIVKAFLQQHSHWWIERPSAGCTAEFATEAGWLTLLPPQRNMDGFFMVRLRQAS